MWKFWFGWIVFVVYGSLIPFEFHPLPLDIAMHKLLNAPMLNLGVDSRADWVANGVLYFPVGFFGSVALAGRTPSRGQGLLLAMLSFLFGVVLACAVEFAQTFFPLRTVSINDLLAEVIGTAFGALTAWFGIQHSLKLLRAFDLGGRVFGLRLLNFYALIFPALVLFPFDLLVSRAEWQAKLSGLQIGLWVAESARNVGGAKLIAKLALETVVVIPLGILWALWDRAVGTAPRPTTGFEIGLRSAFAGAIVGLLIEIAQLAMISGQSQGISVLTRAAGFALGATFWHFSSAWTVEGLRSELRKFSNLILTSVLLLLVAYNGAWRGPWLDFGRIWHRLATETSFVPLYYHYYTSELQATISLVAVSLCYAPFGLLGWAWHVRPGVVAILALALSGLMEFSKAFSNTTHPDPTNLWIAAAAAWLMQSLIGMVFSQPANIGAAVESVQSKRPAR